MNVAVGDRERRLVEGLQRGDESAYAELVETYTPTMLRVARGYVHSHEAAEDVVQDTWIAVIRGVEKFEGRSTLRTWLFTVLVNIAKARGVRDRDRQVAEGSSYPGGATVDPNRFRPPTDPEWPGHWAVAPTAWPSTPEGSALEAELVAVTRRELDRLPDRQRAVVALRDVLGLGAEEVCSLLSLSTANQRVLLHRGRARIREHLATYLGRL